MDDIVNEPASKTKAGKPGAKRKGTPPNTSKMLITIYYQQDRTWEEDKYI